MAGCTKAGRKKKSRSNAAYIAERRQEVNKAKRAKRIAKAIEKKNNRPMVQHGTARELRRKAWMFAIGGMWENQNRLSFQKYEANQ